MSSGLRKIVVNGRVWHYRIGRSFIVANAEDNNERRLDSLPTICKMGWSDIERGTWKKWLHITPKMIADWLENPPGPKIEQKSKHEQKYCPKCEGEGYVYKDGAQVDCDACTVLSVDFTKEFADTLGGRNRG